MNICRAVSIVFSEEHWLFFLSCSFICPLHLWYINLCKWKQLVYILYIPAGLLNIYLTWSLKRWNPYIAQSLWDCNGFFLHRILQDVYYCFDKMVGIAIFLSNAYYMIYVKPRHLKYILTSWLNTWNNLQWYKCGKLLIWVNYLKRAVWRKPFDNDCEKKLCDNLQFLSQNVSSLDAWNLW